MGNIRFNCLKLTGFKASAILSLFLLSLFPFISHAAVITVPGDYTTIQAVISAANDGDEIIVSPGTYYENINFNGKNIILRSTDPTSPTVIASTIIDGNRGGSVVTFSGSEGTSCVLSGFTITNGRVPNGGGICGNGTFATVQSNYINLNTAYGYWPNGLGGGLYRCDGIIQNNIISGNSAEDGGGLADCGGIIQNNSITDNSADLYGGGLYQCSGIIQNNTISGNAADYDGGGLYGCNGAIQGNIISTNSAIDGGGLYKCSGTIQNNAISGNIAGSHGGGLCECAGTIQNNTISDNSADWTSSFGGGLYKCMGTMQNNIISRNWASWGGGLWWFDGTFQNNTVVENRAYYGGGVSCCQGPIRNCILWQNVASEGRQFKASSTPSYSCIQGWSGEGIGNIGADPLFVDPEGSDYHLQADSPCIDGGVNGYWFGWPQRDRDGNCRIIGSRVDMGCYEYGSATDRDGDLLSDSEEALRGTNPAIPDSDGDGLRDGLEILRDSDPLGVTPPRLWNIPADFSTIQMALGVSIQGDEIVVAPGTYSENLQFCGADVVLRSTNPASTPTVASTIIDGSSVGSVVKFLGVESPSCTLSGLTLTNGYARAGGGIWGNGTLATIEYSSIIMNTAYGGAPYGHGGGLYLCNGAIQHNTISGNSADVYGGGLYGCDGSIQNNTITRNPDSGLDSCNGIIQGNSISDNHYYGLSNCNGTIRNNTISANSTGLYECNGLIQSNCISDSSFCGLHTCNGIIQNNMIFNNSAPTYYKGSGLYDCDGVIQNNTISGNSTGYGGGLAYCDGTIENNTIADNSAAYEGGGLYKCYATIRNCIIWGNSAVSYAQIYESPTPSYSCIEGWKNEGRGNISSDPNFIDPSHADYHLQADSPCIDAGNTYYIFYISWEYISYIADIDGECRIFGESIDIGSDEYGSHLDSDGDLLADDDEATLGSDPHSPDTDGDGLRDGPEVLRGTSPVDFNTPPGILIPSQISSIQEAIFLAFPLEEITVSSGTYNENIHFLGKNVVVQSTDPGTSSVVASTIIDGNRLGSVVTFFGTESSDCILSGLTIRNGYATNGGGIHGSGTHATIQSCTILENSAGDDGGGLYECDGTIQFNTIEGNYGYSGAGLCSCDGTIQYNTISGNLTTGTYGDGGGLAFCNGTIQYNIISGNWATTEYSEGGGLYYSNGIIRNNLILGNWANSYGGGLSKCKGTIEHNDVWCNAASSCGGGLSYCRTVLNNNIWDNSADSSGGGLWECGRVENNIISENSSKRGGGLSMDYYLGKIIANTICGNLASDRGGGLWNCNGDIQNNLIFGNSAEYGGAICNSFHSIESNTIYGNSAEFGGGLAYSGNIVNCIIWQNSASEESQVYECSTPAYSCIQDWTGEGIGNIIENPEFIDPDNGDFHLHPTSPCIDAGHSIYRLTEDFEGDPRPMDGTSELRGDGSDYDIGAHEFPGAFALQQYNFEPTNEGWTPVQLPTYFTPPDFYFMPGQIILTAQNNTNTYGYWTSEADAVPVIADCLYRTEWTVATDVTDALAVPHMRLRVNSQNLQQADMLVVGSSGDGSYAPTPGGRTYEMYFLPPESCLGKPEDQDDLILSFDMLNFDPSDAADGSLMLDSVVVDAIPLETLDTPTLLRTWSFDTDAEGWQLGGAPIFTAPLSDNFGDALWLIAQDNTNTFGFWSSPSEGVQIEANKLYRVQFDVSSDLTERDAVPCLRLRVQSEDFQAGIMKVISSVTGAEMSPTLAGRTYDLYFYPPQSLVGTESDSILVAFDILNFDPSDAATGALMLDSVLVESLDVP